MPFLCCFSANGQPVEVDPKDGESGWSQAFCVMQPPNGTKGGLYQGVVFAVSKNRGILKVAQSAVFQDKKSAVDYFKGTLDYDSPEGCRIAKVIVGPNGFMNAKGVAMKKVPMEGEESRINGKELYKYRGKRIDLGIEGEGFSD